MQRNTLFGIKCRRVSVHMPLQLPLCSSPGRQRCQHVSRRKARNVQTERKAAVERESQTNENIHSWAEPSGASEAI